MTIKKLSLNINDFQLLINAFIIHIQSYGFINGFIMTIYQINNIVFLDKNLNKN